jgi:hypothetical protein
MLVFFDPESDVGSALGQLLGGPVRVVSEAQRAKLARDADPARSCGRRAPIGPAAR